MLTACIVSMRMRISKAVPQGRGLRSLKSTVWWLPLSIYYPNTVHFFNLEGYANTHVHLYVPQRCCTLYGTREFELLGTSGEGVWDGWSKKLFSGFCIALYVWTV